MYKLIPQGIIAEYYNNWLKLCANTCSMYLPKQSSFRGYRININKCQTGLCYCLHKMVCLLSICILISYVGFTICSADSCEYFSMPNAIRLMFLTYLTFFSFLLRQTVLEALLTMVRRLPVCWINL